MANTAIAEFGCKQVCDREHVLSEMTELFHSIVTPENYRECLNDMRRYLEKSELCFEGKIVPISTFPTMILREEIEEVKRCGELIQKILLKLHMISFKNIWKVILMAHSIKCIPRTADGGMLLGLKGGSFPTLA